jgi:hypothetical protein
MTVIKINAITVPDDAGDELAQRFAARAGAVDNQDGFEGFELLRPTDERKQWLVVTRGAMTRRSRAGCPRRPSPTGTPEPIDRHRTVARSRCRPSCGPTRWPGVRTVERPDTFGGRIKMACGTVPSQ